VLHNQVAYPCDSPKSGIFFQQGNGQPQDDFFAFTLPALVFTMAQQISQSAAGGGLFRVEQK